MKSIQFIQTTPEQLKKEIIEGLKKSLLPELYKELQHEEATIYLTRQEVATMLKINISTVDLWRKNSILSDYAIGNRIYFKRKEVEEALIKIS